MPHFNDHFIYNPKLNVDILSSTNGVNPTYQQASLTRQQCSITTKDLYLFYLLPF